MSCWNNPKANSSYVTKLDLNLCRPKCSRTYSHVSQPSCLDHCYEKQTGLDSVSYDPASRKDAFTHGRGSKSGEASALHCSRLDIKLEQQNKIKYPAKSPLCTCSCTATQPHMPWRYSSSCSSSEGSQMCFGQGGFAHGHGCGFKNASKKKQSAVTIQSTSRSSSSNDCIKPKDPFCSASKSQSSWTSRLDLVLAKNSAVSTSQIGQPYTIFTSCSSDQASKDYAENVTPVSNMKGVQMYISSCSLTVQPLHSRFQGSSPGQPVLLMPQRDNSPKQYSVGFQTTPKGFIVSEAPSLQITQFQLTRSPSDTPNVQETSTSNIWLSPEKLQKVSGTSGSPEMVPNVLVFQRSSTPGSRTNLYPVILPTHPKASKVTLMIGSPVAPVPVQIIQEYNRSPTPAIFISNSDQPLSAGGFSSGYLLSINPITCSKPKHRETHSSDPAYGNHPVRCKPVEPYLCQSPTCPVMPRIQSHRASSAPIHVSIEAFGSRRDAVRISISHSRDTYNNGAGS